MSNRSRPSSAILVLLALAIARFALHLWFNGNYGFHRDELQVLDDAQHLDWGYVAYPPLTPFLGRVELMLFGTSLAGFRVFAALAQCAVMVLAGLIARELGGRRFAQVAAAVATACMPASLLFGSVFMYSSLDMLWWVAAAWLVLRLVNGADARTWLALGLVFGLGLMTRYTIAFCAVGLLAGVAATPLRRQLPTPWPWLGAGLALLVFLPNLAWQFRHDFIYLDFFAHIHARDIRWGRTAGFLPEQLYLNAGILTLPIWIAGLAFVAFARSMRPYRAVACMYVVPLALFAIARGRGYYMAPAYPMLLAAGCVAAERWFAGMRPRVAAGMRAALGVVFAFGLALGAAATMPIAPVNSSGWRFSRMLHDTFAEQIGWQELVQRVADVYRALPDEERAHAAILANNYGEAGAIDLYGPALGLPAAISRTNSYWYRGYGDPPPSVVIELGSTAEEESRSPASCTSFGRFRNREGVDNEESASGYEIFVCRGIPPRWPAIWGAKPSFG